MLIFPICWGCIKYDLYQQQLKFPHHWETIINSPEGIKLTIEAIQYRKSEFPYLYLKLWIIDFPYMNNSEINSFTKSIKFQDFQGKVKFMSLDSSIVEMPLSYPISTIVTPEGKKENIWKPVWYGNGDLKFDHFFTNLYYPRPQESEVKNTIVKNIDYEISFLLVLQQMDSFDIDSKGTLNSVINE